MSRIVAASVHQRLLNHSRAAGGRFNDVLQRYALERWLYRLSVSDHANPAPAQPPGQYPDSDLNRTLQSTATIVSVGRRSTNRSARTRAISCEFARPMPSRIFEIELP
jgi:hypothetical protein